MTDRRRRSCCALAVAATLFLAAPLLLAAPPLLAADASAGTQLEEDFDWLRVPEVIFDLIILRPLGTAATVAGLPMFLASCPLLVPSGEYLTSWDIFVLAPAEYTFRRPLGDF